MGEDMVQQQLFSFFMEEGYQQIPSNLPEFTLYFLMENNNIRDNHQEYLGKKSYLCKN